MTAIFGGTVLGVEGNYDDVNRLCVELVAEHADWAFVNVNLRPYYAEGSKTLAFEICEQLGWRTPDQVVVPLASGSQFTKVAKGFKQFIDLGLVEGDAPVLFGAQATGCSPIADGLRRRRRRRHAPASEHDRALARHRQSRRRALRARRAARAAAATAGRCTTRRSSSASGCSHETEGVFAETAGGVTDRVAAPDDRARHDRPPTSPSSRSSRATASRPSTPSSTPRRSVRRSSPRRSRRPKRRCASQQLVAAS